MKRLLLLFVLLLFTTGFAFSADFGLLLIQDIEIDNDVLVYTPGFAPWFSFNNGRGLSVYLSGLITIPFRSYSDDAIDSSWTFTPELTRTALNYRINQSMFIEAGRTTYTDAAGFVASGLFDGLRFTMFMPFGAISANAFYTGFQFKETARILMTSDDILNFSTSWDFNNFSDYFASRRFFASLRGDFPLGAAAGLSAELLAQFDLNNNDEKLNSQYGIVLANIFPTSTMRFTVGGLFSFMQGSHEIDDETNNETGFAFGGLAQFRMNLPTAFNDQIGLTAKFTSGSNEPLSTFMPISSHSQGIIFPEALSGLASFGLNYDVRFNPTMYFETSFNYFMRTFDVPEENNLYGGEISATFAWQPFDDLRATLGGGVFLPSLGNFYPNNTDVMWKIRFGISLAL